jgi:hypothetical protein
MSHRFTTSVCIDTALPRNEVRERIHAASGGLMTFTSGLTSPFTGSVGGDSCELIAVGGGRDLQKRILRLSFVERANDGTILNGGFVLRPQTISFAACWFGFVFLFLVGGLIAVLRGGRDDSTLVFVWGPLGMLTVGALFGCFLFFLGRYYERSMVRFLETLLEGQRTDCNRTDA